MKFANLRNCNIESWLTTYSQQVERDHGLAHDIYSLSSTTKGVFVTGRN